ncbi:MAG: acetyl xylan esterase, partial [Lachnospiraceae bacterium]|nr:acetyl xylan esterase [Lachnospiraceae bacterium]
GGIVDTPWGDWYAMLFQDHGAVGRIPVLIPMRFENGFPVMGENGRMPERITVKSTRPEYVYAPLYESDDFGYPSNANKKTELKKVWQFNHEPVEELWEVSDNSFRISTGKLCQNPVQAQNTLTQRLLFPRCRVEVTLDAQKLNDGDYAGLCALQGCYGMIAVKKEEGKTYLVMGAKETGDESTDLTEPERKVCREYERILLESQKIRLYLEADFWQMKDQAVFGYVKDGTSIQVGNVHRLFFELDHFCGARVGLFMYSTELTGGTAVFSDFVYRC